MGPDWVIEHLERRLAGERQVIVAAPPRRGAMVATRERPTPTTDLPKRPRTGWAIALTGFAVAIAAIVGAVILFGGDDDVAAPESPAEFLERYAVAIQEVEPGRFAKLNPVPDEFLDRFLDWHLGLGMNPTFSNCSIAGSASTSLVACDLTAGEDYFFSTVQGENLTATVGAVVDSNGSLVMTAWPDPPGVVDVERDMREWIRLEHPELESEMFGFDFANVVKFDKTAGELHMEYLDEYLAYRKANS